MPRDPDAVTITARISRREREALHELARRDHRTASGMIRHLIAREVERAAKEGGGE